MDHKKVVKHKIKVLGLPFSVWYWVIAVVAGTLGWLAGQAGMFG